MAERENDMSDAPESGTPEVDGNAEPAEDSLQGQLAETTDKVEQTLSPKETKAEKKKWTLKVDGKDEEVEEEELVQRAQLESGARKRMQEAAQLKKDAIEFIRELKENPGKVLSHKSIGVDVVKFAQEILSRQLQDEARSPEEKAREEKDQELEDLRKKYKEEIDARKNAELSRYKEAVERDLDEKMTEAMDAEKLPKKPLFLKRMADVMLSFYDKNEQITAKQAARVVKKELYKEYKEFIDSSEDSIFDDVMSDTARDRFRKRNLAKLKQAQEVKKVELKQSTDMTKSEPNADRPKTSIKDWLKAR
jgi:hypothetical protein